MFWGRNKKTRKGKLAEFLILHIAPYNYDRSATSPLKTIRRKKRKKERRKKKNMKKNHFLYKYR